MKTFARIIVCIEWAITFVVSYFLLQFGADRSSRLVTSKYIDGNFSGVDVWMTFLGFVAVIAIFCLVHPKSRFYAAATLAVLLGLDSLNSLTVGEPQLLLVPMLSLASATIVVLSRRPSKSIISQTLGAPLSSPSHAAFDIVERTSAGCGVGQYRPR